MTFPVGTTFHPTFLYEALWNLAGIAVLLYLDRRYKLGYGRVFALYVMIYTAGRGWIESLRIDTIELNNVLGLRWGVWMSIILFAGAAAYFVVTGRRHRPPDTREPSPYVDRAGRRRTKVAAETGRTTDEPSSLRPSTTRTRRTPRKHRLNESPKPLKREGFVSRNGACWHPTAVVGCNLRMGQCRPSTSMLTFAALLGRPSRVR